MAIVSIMTTFLLLLGLTELTDVSPIVQFLIALIGLGVSIDYSLLVVSRWREERSHGHAGDEAVQRAMETAGRAVVFSGITVAIGLLALIALPLPFLRSMGYGGMLIPVVSVLVAITLLPVVMSKYGARLDWPHRRTDDKASRTWTRWAAAVSRRRWIAAAGGMAVILALAIAATAVAGTVIGVPTLRLRGDYIAIVTLAFGEIIGVVAVNGQSVSLGGGQTLTAGNLGIPAVDLPYFPGVGRFSLLNLRSWYWLILGIMMVVLFVNLRLRDSRLGRAWVALREDEVAAVSMGVPAVRTKLLAYAIGATFGGMSGAFLGAYFTTVNAGQFAFSFSIFVLSMIIVGGLGSIWGAVLGALLLSYINYYLIPDVLNTVPHSFGLNFDLTQLSFGIFGFLLVLVMVLRPQGLFPERRRRLELTAQIAAQDSELAERV
jgi:ABC-type branched-subunit amino acid transport system permease subunit